jgi:leucyl aminopeptidase
MNIRVAKPSQKAHQTVILFDSFSQLSPLNLNKQETAYVKTRIKEKGDHILRLNRHPEYLHLVRPAAKKQDTYKTDEQLRLLGHKTLRMLGAEKAEEVLVKSASKSFNPLAFAEGVALGNYQFLKYFSNKASKESTLKALLIEGVSAQEATELEGLIRGVYTARDLVNEPLSYLTAKQLAQEASRAGETFGFNVEVLNKKKIESLKMGGLLAVNRGSQDPPTFSILEYKSAQAKNKKPIILVGKGVVYDTGGLSLKPTPGSMDSMKSDMGGSAAVIGTFIAAAANKLPVHLIGLIPATDNRPGENAYVPGDVIKMFDGSTVEVLNTDAEGRMLLADALAYAKKYDPSLVIDLATLTGAAAVAVGKYGLVAMGTAGNKAFADLSKAGENTYERLAQFPFWEEYDELLKSSIADQKNIGGREGGAITAGKFLEKFTDYPWIHLDIAGPAFLDADHGYRLKGGTGVGVRLLYNYLKNLK